MQRYLKPVFILILFYLIVTFILHPGPTMDAAFQGMDLCVRVVIPSLFPFFICSRLLVDLGFAAFCSRILSPVMRPLFGVPGSGALAVVLGILSGYPIGAATIVNLYETGFCTKAEGERLLAFCNNAGPLFIIGSVGVGILHSQKLGMILYLVHLTTALITGLLFRKSGQKILVTPTLPPGAVAGPNLASSLVTAVSEGVNSILKVCGFVVFFSVVCAALPWNSPLLHGLLEITGGIRAMVDHPFHPFLLPTISAYLALSGASILLQTAGIVLPSGLSMKPCLIGKLIQAGLSFALTFLLFRFLPLAKPTFAGTVPTPPLPTPGQFLAFALTEFLVALGMIGFMIFLALLMEKLPQKK